MQSRRKFALIGEGSVPASMIVKEDVLDEPATRTEIRLPNVLTFSEDDLRMPVGVEDVTSLKSFDLPFTIRLVRTEAHLSKAVQVRAQAFLKHAPRFGAQLIEPEPADRAPGNVVLLAESKSTGAAEGSVRLETNFNVRTEFERIIDLPYFLNGKTLAQASRLGVRPGPGGPLVKYALVKAAYRYCLATQVDYVLLAARTPVDRAFLALGFKEVFSEPTFLKFPGQGDKFLRLFAFDVVSGERRWRRIKHPLYRFMVEEYHPDIEIFSSVRGMWTKPRSRVSSAKGRTAPTPAFEFPVV